MHNKSCQEIWEKCLNFIKFKLSERSFKTWFTPIIPKKLENNVLTIQVPSQFFYEWLEDNYLPLLKDAIHKILGSQVKLEYSIVIDKGNLQHQAYTINLPTNKQAYANASNKEHVQCVSLPKSPFTLENVPPKDRILNLNPNYTFDNFIEGDCNQLAKSAAQAIAKKPGRTSFNPLVIYGNVGNGKTHIVQAIGNQVVQNFSEKFVLYVSSEKFTSQFIEGIRNNVIQNFINFYLQVDVLLIDDVQFLAKKEKTQEFFFNIFNHLHQYNKQIVMTSDCPPSELKGLQERLLSRFKWGLIADLQKPDFETRLAIIQSKIKRDGIYLDDDLIRYIAYSVDSNVRELEGVLISLIAHASLNKKDLDLPLVKQVLSNTIKQIDTEVNIDYLQKIIASHYKLTLQELLGKSRKKEIVLARQVAMYLSKEYTLHSLKAIGDYFGGRDHSTVIHAIQTVKKLLSGNKKFYSQFMEVQKKIRH